MQKGCRDPRQLLSLCPLPREGADRTNKAASGARRGRGLPRRGRARGGPAFKLLPRMLRKVACPERATQMLKSRHAPDGRAKKSETGKKPCPSPLRQEPKARTG